MFPFHLSVIKVSELQEEIEELEEDLAELQQDFTVADPGFVEGGFQWCSCAQSVREKFEATPTLE